MKITKTNLEKGMKFKQKGTSLDLCKYEYDSDGFIKLQWLKADLEGAEITITEKCKSYQGSGSIVRYTIDGQPGEFLSFWTDFKSNAEYIIDSKITVAKTTPIEKGDKTWTEIQLSRLGERGYYITYYGEPNDEPKKFGVIYIGNGKCFYLDELGHFTKWETLSWVSAPTKKKIAVDKANSKSKMERYIYFKTHADLMRFENIEYQPIAMNSANLQEERNIALEQIL
jgi:hypothetical protein